LPKLKGRNRGGVSYVVAERYRVTGNLAGLRQLFATDDVDVKESVLNALWEEPPPSSPAMGPGIVALALEAASHPTPEVRAMACSVMQNQSAWGVDVSPAVEALHTLLRDPDCRVRMQAACAVGNLAKRKYDFSRHLAGLSRNLRDPESAVRKYSAWAIWQLSRSRNDIGAAITALVKMLTRQDYGEDTAVPRNAAGALLHFARKSPQNLEHVRKAAAEANLDASRKEVRRFQEQLAQGG